MENQVEQTDGSTATLVQRGADAVGTEEGAAAEKEDEGKTEKVTFWNDVSEKVQMNCRFWMDDMV